MAQGSLKVSFVHGRGAMAAAFFVAWLASLSALSGRLSAADVFTVEDVAVDATAENAAAAREKAIAIGQQAALARLLERLVPRDQRAALPHPSSAEVGDLVRDFAVDDEKTSAVRYLAHLSVRFRADAIRSLLRSGNVPFAETMSKPIVVLPVLKSGGEAQLWERMTPWREAWVNVDRDGLVPFVIPVGDLDDVVAINAARALAGDREGLAAVAWRYKAGDVIVATAEPREQDGRVTSVQVTTVRYPAGGGNSETAVRNVAGGGGGPEAVYGRAANEVAQAIEDNWKRANLIRFDSERSLVAVVHLDALKDLLDVRKRLEGVSVLRSYDVLYLARDAAQLRLNYFGDERQLSTALAQNDLTLEQGATDWILRRSGAPHRAAPPEPAPQVPAQP